MPIRRSTSTTLLGAAFLAIACGAWPAAHPEPVPPADPPAAATPTEPVEPAMPETLKLALGDTATTAGGLRVTLNYLNYVTTRPGGKVDVTGSGGRVRMARPRPHALGDRDAER